MLRAFILPSMMLVVLMIAGAWAQVLAYRDVFAQANQAGSMAFVWQQAISQGFGTLTFLTDLGALAWFGAWMGLTSKKTSAAFLKTILFVQFLPWLAMIFVQMFLMMPMAFTGANGQVWIYVSAVAQGLLSLGINIAFIAVSRRKMLVGFREMVSGVGAPRASQLKPPLIPAPPVLSNPPPTPAE